LEKHYQVLTIKVNILKNRVFNLNNSKHKLEFIKVMKAIAEKQKYSDKMEEQAKVEGIVLNYYEILDLLFIDKNPAVYYNYNQKDLYEIQGGD
jgi:hypothetical protein